MKEFLIEYLNSQLTNYEVAVTEQVLDDFFSNEDPPVAPPGKEESFFGFSPEADMLNWNLLEISDMSIGNLPQRNQTDERIQIQPGPVLVASTPLQGNRTTTTGVRSCIATPLLSADSPHRSNLLSRLCTPRLLENATTSSTNFSSSEVSFKGSHVNATQQRFRAPRFSEAGIKAARSTATSILVNGIPYAPVDAQDTGGPRVFIENAGSTSYFSKMHIEIGNGKLLEVEMPMPRIRILARVEDESVKEHLAHPVRSTTRVPSRKAMNKNLLSMKVPNISLSNSTPAKLAYHTGQSSSDNTKLTRRCTRSSRARLPDTVETDLNRLRTAEASVTEDSDAGGRPTIKSGSVGPPRKTKPDDRKQEHALVGTLAKKDNKSTSVRGLKIPIRRTCQRKVRSNKIDCSQNQQEGKNKTQTELGTCSKNSPKVPRCPSKRSTSDRVLRSMVEKP